MLYIITLSYILTSCSFNNKGTINNHLSIVADDSISGNKIATVEPELQKVLKNPLNGWVVYGSINSGADFWNKYDSIYVPEISDYIKVSEYAHTFYLRAGWYVFNPREGEYGWDTNEKLKFLIDNARKRGMRLAFRIVVDSRDKRINQAPDYVKEAGAKGFESKSGDVTVWSPYPDDPIFQEKYEKFIEAFAEKFNDSDVVDFIDGFGLGKWGEAHSMRYQNIQNREKVFKWVVDLYSKHFTKVPLAINYHRLIGTEKDWDKPDGQSEALLNYAFEKGYMLRHDAFGMTEYYMQWERDLVSKWKYKRPVIMEGGWVTKHHNVGLDPRGYKTKGDVRKAEFEDSKEAHVNMMDFRVNETESWFEEAYPLVKEFIAEGGYRLYPDKLSLPKEINDNSQITIIHRWNNLGWGYCPNNLLQWNYKYKVAFALLDKETSKVKAVYVDNNSDPSKWLKDSPVTYTFSPSVGNIENGTYIWAVAIVDTTKNNEKGIDISVKANITPSGWLPLFDVTVK